MKTKALAWLIAGLVTLILAGILGDQIFYPHPADFSFRNLSNYGAAAIMLIVACVLWNEK